MPLSDIQTLLDSFAPIQLIEMERVMLMNRAESKYLFAVSKLPVLLEELSEHYKILDIGTIRTFPYHTTYLDTYDSLFYTQQVRGKLNRQEKITCVSPFAVVMKQMGIRCRRFSKYCMGSALIMDMPRKNLLKFNLLLINKIENEYITANRS
jgi:hypothetical protein